MNGEDSDNVTDARLIDGGTVTLFESMATRDLRILHSAFTLDRQAAGATITHAFCDARLALIDRILRERGDSGQ